jgi:DNA-binding transcriptional regulator YiaG
MTQAEFSAVYRVPLRALQNWEQGRFAFLPSIDTLLTLIEREPETIARILSE